MYAHISDVSKKIPLNCNIRIYYLCDTEALKYPRICMSSVLEIDKAKISIFNETWIVTQIALLIKKTQFHPEEIFVPIIIYFLGSYYRYYHITSCCTVIIKINWKRNLNNPWINKITWKRYSRFTAAVINIWLIIAGTSTPNCTYQKKLFSLSSWLEHSLWRRYI